MRFGPYLRNDHRKTLREGSGISDTVILNRGYQTITDQYQLLKLGFANYQCGVPGLLIPLHGPKAGAVGYEFRPDHPRTIKGKQVKYEWPKGKPLRLDVPPSVRDRLGDPSAPLIVTEGSKKADSLASLGWVCVALNGVSGFRTKNTVGGVVALGEWDDIALNRREVYVIFDSDAARNKLVEMAERRLARFLESRGAKVSIVRIGSQNGVKVGIDDYIVAGGSVNGLLKNCCIAAGDEDKSQTGQLLKLVYEAAVELWHSDEEQAFATFDNGNGLVSANVNSGRFKSYCQNLFYKEHGRAIAEPALKSALETLLAKARFDGPRYPVGLRVGWADSLVFVFLANEVGRIVRISAHGWTLVSQEDCPIRFVKGTNTLPLPEPTHGGSLDDLWPFVNVDPADRPLVRAWMVGGFLPKGTMAILIATGEQGTGKTFGLGIVRELIDPSKSGLRGIPRTHEAMRAAVNSSYVLGFDNVSHISPDMSDTLCIIASGGAITDRKLYSDADEFVVEARRPSMLNGIGEVGERPDLLDRSLLVQFGSLSNTREPEAELLEKFEAVKPSILGALFDAVSKGLAGRSLIHLQEDYRMLDFAKFVIAAEEDFQGNSLRSALMNNRKEVQSGVLENDELAQAVMEYVRAVGPISDPSKTLLSQLDTRRGATPVHFGWPKNAKQMGKHLAKIAPLLRTAGFEINRKRTPGRRFWEIFERVGP